MKEIKNCSILVTGASGFIGANLVRKLILEKAQVHLILRPSSNRWRLNDILTKSVVYEGDITDAKFVWSVFKHSRPTVVVHCAMWHGHPKTPTEEQEAMVISVLGTLHMLQASANFKIVKFIHFGSSTEYGHRNRPLTEKSAMKPTIFRGLAKGCAAMVCDYFARVFKVPVVNLRLFSVYGYWESPERFIPTLIRSALWGGEVPLTAVDARHDFVFVEDVVDAFLKALETELPPGEVFNIGTGKQWSNRQVVRIVEALIGRTLPVKVGAHPGNPPDTNFWVAKIDKARKLLNWQPKHELSEGLKLTMEWMKQHAKWYRKQG